MSSVPRTGWGAPTPEGGKSSAARLIQVATFVAIWAVSLFLCAGRFNWARGWLFLGLCLGLMAAALMVIRRCNPGLLAARATWRYKDTKTFDKTIQVILTPLQVLQPAIAGLDFRFGWSSMPAWALYWGCVLFVLGWALMTYALAVNRFAETTVRIQTERGHTAISSGPYRFVRHPMYVGMTAYYLAAPLVLGSMWALAVGALMSAILAIRTALEDATLTRELPGYREYAAETRYRLIPGLW